VNLKLSTYSEKAKKKKRRNDADAGAIEKVNKNNSGEKREQVTTNMNGYKEYAFFLIYLR
jgi:hypothetical protein